MPGVGLMAEIIVHGEEGVWGLMTKAIKEKKRRCRHFFSHQTNQLVEMCYKCGKTRKRENKVEEEI
jgi:hypothetical protein